MKLLVCGGRDYRDELTLFRALDKIRLEHPVTMVIQGGAKGADTLARTWAERRLVPFAEYPADWNRHGRGAGPIRNRQMLTDGKPDLVVAFPRQNGEWGSGTLNMIAQAQDAGVEVQFAAKPPLAAHNMSR
ncbi:MAG TPA: DUF2493 domain-containing protein [Phenylobacterium sp.]